MSLAQHVTQDEGFDYEGPSKLSDMNHKVDKELGLSGLGESQEGLGSSLRFRSEAITHTPEWRQMKFGIRETVEEEPHRPQYRVSAGRRLLQVITGIVFCWLSSGIVFGYAAIKPILIKEGVYAEYCPDLAIKAQADTGYANPCTEQDLRLNLFFTGATITANIASLVTGTIMDRYGRRVCWLIGALLLAAGSALMGSSFAIKDFDGYMLGNVFLAAGGTAIFVPSFQLSTSFPKYSGLIVAMVTGAFDASAAVYLFYRMIYEATEGAFSVEKFFFCYLIVPILILVAELTYMPDHAYETFPELEQRILETQNPAKDFHDSDEDLSSDETVSFVRDIRTDKRLAKLDRIESVCGDAEERELRVKHKREIQEASGVWGVLHGMPAHRQMMSPWFLFILFLTVFQMLRMNFFIATVRNQYQYLLGSDTDAEAINHFFDAALPLGGVIATPFIGMLLNNLSVPTTFATLTVLVFLIGLANCLPYLWAGYATVVLFSLFRPFYYASISDYATKVFGYRTFGTLYGTLICASGFFSLSQALLDRMIHGFLHGNPTLINMTLGIVGTIIGAALTGFVWVKGRNFVQFKEEMEIDRERLILLTNETSNYDSLG